MKYKGLYTLNEIIKVFESLRDDDNLGDYPIVVYLDGKTNKPYRIHALDNLNENNEPAVEIHIEQFPMLDEIIVEDEDIFNKLPEKVKNIIASQLINGNNDVVS